MSAFSVVFGLTVHHKIPFREHQCQYSALTMRPPLSQIPKFGSLTIRKMLVIAAWAVKLDIDFGRQASGAKLEQIRVDFTHSLHA
jgi:hypothetical protein